MIIEKFLDLIYPPVCMSCKNIFDYNKAERYICNVCKEYFELEKVKRCEICGRIAIDEILCELCKKHKNSNKNFYFTKNYSLFPYNDVTSGTIYNFKYGKKFENVKSFGKLFEDFFNENTELFEKIDLLVPVPMYYKKERVRGFNQAKVIAKEFSRISKIKYDDTSLFRIRETVVQSSLTPKARHNNLDGAFVVKNNKVIKDKTVMLIDDIYTTGSTVINCSKELIGNGSKEVISLTLAITEKKEEIST